MYIKSFIILTVLVSLFCSELGLDATDLLQADNQVEWPLDGEPEQENTEDLEEESKIQERLSAFYVKLDNNNHSLTAVIPQLYQRPYQGKLIRPPQV